MVTIDSGDIFRVITQNTDYAFSGISISIDAADEFHIANLCLHLSDALEAQSFWICKTGDILMRITSPSFLMPPLEEIKMICETIGRFSSGSLLWGVETDDSIETINVEMIYQAAPRI